MADTLIESVSDTAFWVAHYRALESERKDALFHDPFAAMLAGDRGREIAKSMPMAGIIGWVMALRTVIIDDFIRHAIAEGADAVLNLGAGLDTRPYRMDLPASLQWFEADQPQVIAYKEERLSSETPRCRLERARVDLSDAAARRELLSRIDARAAKLLVMAEGVLPYLTAEQVGALADDLHALEKLRYWIADYHSPEAIKYRERSGLQQKMQNAPFQFKPNDWFGFFRQHGWEAKRIRYLAEEAERVQRPIPLPLIPKIFFTIRVRAASKERRAAYVLLGPAAAGRR